MKLITVLGWYGKNNCGDESYKMAFPILFPQYRFHFTDKITLADINRSDAFILGGGDVLSDVFLDQLIPIQKPKHIISTSANTNITRLTNFNNIIVRDLESVRILQSKNISCSYYPDVAFVLEGDLENGRDIIKSEFKKQQRDLYNKVVVVVINGFLSDPQGNAYDVRKFLAFQKLSYDLGHVMDYTPASFVFVPFGQHLPWDDRVTNGLVAQKCKFWKKNLVFWKELSVQDILDILAAADAVISTRLHSTIFSIATLTPFIDIIHNHKNAWLIETLNKKNWSMSYEAFEKENGKAMLKNIFDGRRVKEIEQLLQGQRQLLYKGLANVRLL